MEDPAIARLSWLHVDSLRKGGGSPLQSSRAFGTTPSELPSQYESHRGWFGDRALRIQPYTPRLGKCSRRAKAEFTSVTIGCCGAARQTATDHDEQRRHHCDLQARHVVTVSRSPTQGKARCSRVRLLPLVQQLGHLSLHTLFVPRCLESLLNSLA